MIKCILLLCGLFFSSGVWAFTCFLSMVKDTCWTNYDVQIKLFDTVTSKVLVTMDIPSGTSWLRQKFECKPGESIKAQATFNPPFWEGDQGKIYSMIREMTLPWQVVAGETAWNVTICYPEKFAEVPYPPTAAGNCKCEVDKLPAIPPQ